MPEGRARRRPIRRRLSKGERQRRSLLDKMLEPGAALELRKAILANSPAEATDALEAFGGAATQMGDAASGAFLPLEEAALAVREAIRGRGDLARAVDVFRRVLVACGDAERERFLQPEARHPPKLDAAVLAVVLENPVERAAFLAEGLIGDGARHARQAADAVVALQSLLPATSDKERLRVQRWVKTREMRDLLTAGPAALYVWATARRAAALELSGSEGFKRSADELMHAIAAASADDVALVASFLVDAPKTARILRNFGDVRNARLVEGRWHLRESIQNHVAEFVGAPRLSAAERSRGSQ